MASQRTGILLLATLFLVAIVRSVSALPAGGSPLRDRRPRFVHYADSDSHYHPCGSRGFRRDLQLTAKTIIQTNDTLTMMKEDAFMSGVPTPSVVIEEGSGLVSLFHNLSSYELTIPTIVLHSYSATMRQSMHDTASDLNKLLFKLRFTLRAAGELGDQGWTVEPVPLLDAGDSDYQHYRRDFTFFQQLFQILELLKAELEARLAEC
ncbi:PREDICTED: uncharacterized protein LOC109477601 [Branchiostoma belcheri]|uniref:Uncharacterized protein LOC109477601 n=1 Tax=Branchiostoma belcheri TaxID=7741 RepID=A0A6P4ZCV5_BRABE|nr:PREDICTED: uncharacterized protein LOC109477601 [Branchiostoma belcheri]